MINYFEFGKHANRSELPSLKWSPDSKDTQNPHMLICGSSGAGKTRLLKKIVSYLAENKKHIFMFDLKGDMKIKDYNGNDIGNYIDLTAWDSEFGINPFEFDTGIPLTELEEIISGEKPTKEQYFKLRNSGPQVQVSRFIEIIKKNFLPNMGTAQKDVLNFILSDTYVASGFAYNNPKTWNCELPSLINTQELIKKILAAFNGNSDSNSGDFDVQTGEFILEIRKNSLAIKSLEEREKSGDIDNGEDIKNKIKTLSTKNESLLRGYVEHSKETYTPTDNLTAYDWIAEKGVDFDKYQNKSVIKTLEKLSSYINALVESGVFHSKKPPVKSGLNVINVSGLDVTIQRFIVDVWIGKVFKSCKIRGEYQDLPNKTRGEKCDTYIVIDESKLVAGTARDKNDPYSYLSRIATEARSYGLALVVGSQSAEHFPVEFLKNFASQIIMKTAEADSDTARKSFGVEKQLLEFTRQQQGNTLIRIDRKFSKIKLSSD